MMAAPQLPLLVDVGFGGEILPALDARGIPNHVALAVYSAPPAWIQTVPERCVIFRGQGDPRAQRAMQAIMARWSMARPTVVYDTAGVTRITVYYPFGSHHERSMPLRY